MYIIHTISISKLNSNYGKYKITFSLFYYTFDIHDNMNSIMFQILVIYSIY